MVENYKSEFLHILHKRGLIHQCTHAQELDALFAAGPQKIYIGFDATADSLHVGSLLPLMVLRWAYMCGHTIIPLLGGGTTLVGDPSGKEETRQILNLEVIADYTKGIKESFGRLLPLDSDRVKVLNNVEWLYDLNYLTFLRDIGSCFTVNKMLAFENVKLRLNREQSLSFLEFNYMLCQAYDFYWLSCHEGCLIQAGGSDQWGNIVCGVDLIRRKTQKQAYGLTFPLIQTKSGVKMGKTAEGAVWLSPRRKSPYEYWQYWRNVEDQDIHRFLLLFTCLDEARIEEALKHNPNDAKILLADEATSLLHGPDVLESIHQTVKELKGRSTPYTIEKTNEGISVVSDLPLYVIERLEAEEKIIDMFARAGVFESKGAARRLIREGGITINGERINDENQKITLAAPVKETILHVKIGKKKHLLIQV